MARAFTPVTSLPDDLSYWWTQTAYGGVSPCIQGNGGAGRPFTGCTLPNCVGWSWGRFQQLQDTIDSRLPAIDAGLWFDYAVSQGMDTGSTPKLGAVACFGDGHVCNVEYVSPDGTYIECSESDWSGPLFSYRTRYAVNNWEYGNAGNFQGFIYSNVDYTDLKIWLFTRREKKKWRHILMTS